MLINVQSMNNILTTWSQMRRCAHLCIMEIAALNAQVVVIRIRTYVAMMVHVWNLIHFVDIRIGNCCNTEWKT